MTKPPTKVVPVRVSHEVHASLAAIATRHDISVSDVARWLLVVGTAAAFEKRLEPPSERRKSGLGSASEKTRRRVSRAGVKAKKEGNGNG